MDKVEKQNALLLIEQALNIATQKGAFTITDIEAILSALKKLKDDESGEG